MHVDRWKWEARGVHFSAYSTSPPVWDRSTSLPTRRLGRIGHIENPLSPNTSTGLTTVDPNNGPAYQNRRGGWSVSTRSRRSLLGYPLRRERGVVSPDCKVRARQVAGWRAGMVLAMVLGQGCETPGWDYLLIAHCIVKNRDWVNRLTSPLETGENPVVGTDIESTSLHE